MRVSRVWIERLRQRHPPHEGTDLQLAERTQQQGRQPTSRIWLSAVRFMEIGTALADIERWVANQVAKGLVVVMPPS
jgi:hypothetical protein